MRWSVSLASAGPDALGSAGPGCGASREPLRSAAQCCRVLRRAPSAGAAVPAAPARKKVLGKAVSGLQAAWSRAARLCGLPSRGCAERSSSSCVLRVMEMGSALRKRMATAEPTDRAVRATGSVPAGSGLGSAVTGAAGWDGLFTHSNSGRWKGVGKRAASSSSRASSFFGLLLQQLSAKNRDDSKILHFAATQLTPDSLSFCPQ